MSKVKRNFINTISLFFLICVLYSSQLYKNVNGQKRKPASKIIGKLQSMLDAYYEAGNGIDYTDDGNLNDFLGSNDLQESGRM